MVDSIGSKRNKFDMEDTNLFFRLIITDADKI